MIRFLVGPFKPGSSRVRRRIRAALLVPAAVAAAACSDPTGVDELRSEMLPPPVYHTLWNGVEVCSGRTGDFSRLRWFYVQEFPEEADQKGQWNAHHEITLAVPALWNWGVVAHELLHELLGGDPAHRNAAWDACGLPKGEG